MSHQDGAESEIQGQHMEDASLLDDAVSRERPRLLSYIRRRVRTKEDAEDILQEVFYQLMTSYSVTEPIEKLAAWLFTVARNKVTDWYRKRRPESLPYDQNGRLFDTADMASDEEESPERMFERSLVWEALAEALEELPDKQREVFVMHELEGMSFNDIAERTGEPLNTLLSRKRYAVLFLRERLKELYDEF